MYLCIVAAIVHIYHMNLNFQACPQWRVFLPRLTSSPETVGAAKQGRGCIDSELAVVAVLKPQGTENEISRQKGLRLRAQVGHFGLVDPTLSNYYASEALCCMAQVVCLVNPLL